MWKKQGRKYGGTETAVHVMHSARVRGVCLVLAVFFGVALALSCVQLRQFAGVCDEVRGDTLRLHIRAASDSVADQTAKLRVRDALLELTGRIYAGAGSRADAERMTARSLGYIELYARHVLWGLGVRGRVAAYMTHMYFATSHYRGATLPAGGYDALRIDLGDGRGHNWWCCLYPSLCVAACTGGYDTPDENALVAGDYEIRFRVVEWWQRVAGR